MLQLSGDLTVAQPAEVCQLNDLAQLGAQMPQRLVYEAVALGGSAERLRAGGVGAHLTVRPERFGDPVALARPPLVDRPAPRHGQQPRGRTAARRLVGGRLFPYLRVYVGEHILRRAAIAQDAQRQPEDEGAGLVVELGHRGVVASRHPPHQQLAAGFDPRRFLPLVVHRSSAVR
jgi:hypothetical protein